MLFTAILADPFTRRAAFRARRQAFRLGIDAPSFRFTSSSAGPRQIDESWGLSQQNGGTMIKSILTAAVLTIGLAGYAVGQGRRPARRPARFRRRRNRLRCTTTFTITTTCTITFIAHAPRDAPPSHGGSGRRVGPRFRAPRPCCSPSAAPPPPHPSKERRGQARLRAAITINSARVSRGSCKFRQGPADCGPKTAGVFLERTLRP